MAELYISPSGNDTTGTGTSGNPWATLAKFLSSSASGDTCICAPGTYTWATATITNRTIRAESWANPAIFDGSGGHRTWDLSGTVNIQNADFQNASMTASTNGYPPIFRTDRDLVAIFTNCNFRNITVKADGGIYGGLCGPSNPASSFTESRTTFAGCFFDVTGVTDAIRLMVTARIGATGAYYYQFDHCIFYFHTGGTSDITAIFARVFTQPSLVFDVTLINTILYNVGGTPILYEAANLGTSADHLTNSCFRNITSVPAGTGNITADPLFVDAANGNFDLRPGSPCLGTGVPL